MLSSFFLNGMDVDKQVEPFFDKEVKYFRVNKDNNLETGFQRPETMKKAELCLLSIEGRGTDEHKLSLHLCFSDNNKINMKSDQSPHPFLRAYHDIKYQRKDHLKFLVLLNANEHIID